MLAGEHGSERTPAIAGRPDPLDPAEVVRKLYRSFELRDLSSLGALLVPAVVWDQPGALRPAANHGTSRDLPFATHDAGRSGDDPQRLEGREAVVAHFEILVEESGGRCGWHLQQLHAHPNGVVVAFHEVTGTGAPVSIGCVVYEIALGRIAHLTTMVATRSTSM